MLSCILLASLIVFITTVSMYDQENIYSLEKCNIAEETTFISQDDFNTRYAGQQKNAIPVVFRRIPFNKRFLSRMQLDSLLHRYGHKRITVTTANTHSYDKRCLTLNDYIDRQQNPLSPLQWGNETLYWFGDNLLNNQQWLEEILRFYQPPPYTVANFTQPSFSFGMAGRGTGVPFHFHGPGFQQMIVGRKQWYLSPEKPLFDPNETTLQWFLDKRHMVEQPVLYECTLHPGDVLFFPNTWWHATLNLDFAIFLSTFLSL